MSTTALLATLSLLGQTSTTTPAQHPRTLRISFDADLPGVTLERQVGSNVTHGLALSFGNRGGFMATPYAEQSRSYEALCTAPCEIEMPRVNLPLALSYDGRGPVRTNAIPLEDGLQLHGHYVDNAGVRVGGWVTMLGSLALGTALTAGAAGNRSEPMAGVGIGVGLLGGIIGFVLTRVSDEAELTAGPGGAQGTALSP
ncbi:MAG: hypothetical protein U1E65_34480 [Myxococcota bacterium]